MVVAEITLLDDMLQAKPKAGDFSKNFKLPDKEVKQKERKKKEKKDVEAESETSRQYRLALTSGLAGLSAIAAEKKSIWELSDSEINSVVEPGSRMLERVSVLSPERMDGALLITAILTILIPRILMMQKEKADKMAERQVEREYGDTPREARVINGATPPRNAAAPSVTAKTLLSGL